MKKKKEILYVICYIFHSIAYGEGTVIFLLFHICKEKNGIIREPVGSHSELPISTW